MTAAAFSASYSDWRIVKGRKVVQIVFELPLEKADEAYQVLGGMPIAAAEKWCAIARLNPEGGDATDDAGNGNRPSVSTPPEKQPPTVTQLRPGADKPRRPMGSLPYAQQAALRCQDARFRAFLRETNRRFARNEAEAREYILEACNINSRADIKPGTEAETYWLDIERAYNVWLTEDRAFA